LAGFAVGAVERPALLPLPSIAAGDVLLGLSSSGVHSNGFSLVRKVLSRFFNAATEASIPFSSPAPWDPSTTVSRSLLEPTRIYVRQLLPALRIDDQPIRALSHITGGGFTENIPRCLPKNLGVEIDLASYDLPPVFKWIKREGNIATAELCRTFNCGVGMVAVVAANRVDDVMRVLEAYAGVDKAEVWKLGIIKEGAGVSYKGEDSWQ
jgi:phosphoribosylamine--glycine ligase/phosphoribosylformylglycinamidine cyclo-ligase